MWIMISLYLNIKITSNWAQSNESRIKFINLVWMIANQNFYDICFTYFILRLQLRPTVKGQSFSGPNIWLRSKVKIVPAVQHWMFDIILCGCAMHSMKFIGKVMSLLPRSFPGNMNYSTSKIWRLRTYLKM